MSLVRGTAEGVDDPAAGPASVRSGARPSRREPLEARPRNAIARVRRGRHRGRPPRKYPHLRKTCSPAVRFWLTVGLIPKSAKALVKAGFCSLTDLEGMTREQLLAIRGVGPGALAALEDVVEQPLSREHEGRRASPAGHRVWPEVVWRKRGLPPTAAITVAQVGMTLERLSSISREELLGMPGVWTGAVQACELMLGKEIRSRKKTRGRTSVQHGN